MHHSKESQPTGDLHQQDSNFVSCVCSTEGSPSQHTGCYKIHDVLARKNKELQEAVHILPATIGYLPKKLDLLLLRVLLEKGATEQNWRDLSTSWASLASVDLCIRILSSTDVWLELSIPSGSDPAVMANSLQRCVTEHLHTPCYVSYGVLQDFNLPELEQELEAAAQAAALLHQQSPVSPQVRHRREMLGLFRDALTSGRMCSIKQPIVRLRDRSVTGYEILARIPAESGGYIATTTWIPHVVESHDSLRLATYMLKQVTEEALGHEDCYYSVNLTATDFAEPSVTAALRNIPPAARANIVLELTEWKDSQAVKGLKHRVEAIRAMGYRVAADDFGNGYSSIPTLRSIQFDIVKLDMSLVQSRSQTDMKFTRLVCDLADEIGASIVAEGIETEELLERMLRIGISYGQGFLFC